MYEQFYALTDDPFRLSTDWRSCFTHPSYAKAKAYMQFALHRAEGFVMITGRPGTGKTTLIHDVITGINTAHIKVATLVGVQLDAEELLRMTAFAFGVDANTPYKANVLQRLLDFFTQQMQQGRRSLLVIDEAQDLTPAALEELRLLTNVQHGQNALLQVFLIGQDALRELVRSPAMEQVHQRLVAAWHLQPLGHAETMGYVRHRLEVAGWRGDPLFNPGIFPLVYQFSGGIPRRINLICSRLLLQGFINDSHVLTADDANTVISELTQESLLTTAAIITDHRPSEPIQPTIGHTGPAIDGTTENDWVQLDCGLIYDGGLLPLTVSDANPISATTIPAQPSSSDVSHSLPLTPITPVTPAPVVTLQSPISAPPIAPIPAVHHATIPTTPSHSSKTAFTYWPELIRLWWHRYRWLRWLTIATSSVVLISGGVILAVLQPPGVINVLTAVRTALLFQ